MTINKAQGQTLGNVGLDLCYPVFSHGQLYVGVSRGTNMSKIKILLPQGNKTQNIVYKDILLKLPEVCVSFSVFILMLINFDRLNE